MRNSLLTRRCNAVLATPLLLMGFMLLQATESNAETVITVHLDRGEDLGQNFGSLFEARTDDGAFVIGAGFSGVYNTYYRHDRHTAHFYIRPTTVSRFPTMAPLPRPSELAGNYLFNFDGKVYAANPDVREWNPSASRWDPRPLGNRIDTRVGSDLLSFDGSRVLLNDEIVLEVPKEGNHTGFYYAQGHLFFYHIFKTGDSGYRKHTTDSEGYSKIYACPWKPGDGPVDLRKAVVLTVPIVGENPYAYGQLRNQVLSCSNIGGMYAFRQGSWRTIVDGELETSYQVYTMLSYYDQLLMGQYPTGELFSFDGEEVRRLEGWPPRMDGVRGSSREAQTMVLYAGELYVGVWPWGEVWTYHPELKNWRLAKRMFTHPEPTAATTHPYEQQCAALGGVANQWGQRITSMVPLRDSFLISTSAKWPCKWEPKFDFVADDAWKEYGAVTRAYLPGHLSAPIRWTDETTELRFTLKDDTMQIEQDGEIVDSVALDVSLATASVSVRNLAKIEWGRGAYGVFQGLNLEGNVSNR